jgi:pimeloyl-ACP methyl ester carboxylesterase
MRWSDGRERGRGLELFVRRVVEPPAPPVLLLHGLGVGGAVWQAFARRLLPDLAAVAPDLRGHGQSDAPPDGYEPADYASDLAELLLSTATVAPPVGQVMPGGSAPRPGASSSAAPIVGHSLGALVAVALADLRPELVAWLVLLDPPLDAERRNPDVSTVFRLRHAPAGELEAYLLANNPGGGQHLAATLARLFRQASDAAFRALLDHPPGSPETWDRAPRVHQPCLVLQADPEHGGLLGDAAADAFVARLPNGRRQKLHGAAHALHATEPDTVARAILDFHRHL